MKYLLLLLLLVPNVSMAYTTDEILCHCRKFIEWRGHKMPEPTYQSDVKSGKPRVGSVAVWYWPEKGFGHVAEVVLATETSFWTIGTNENGCGLFLRETKYTDHGYAGWL